MLIKTLTVGNLGTQCYIVSADGADECLVIDPGAEPARTVRLRPAKGSRPSC